MTHTKFNFNQLMLTMIFGIWASEPPPGPGERLKRPGLIGLNVVVDLPAVMAISFSPYFCHFLCKLFPRRICIYFLDKKISCHQLPPLPKKDFQQLNYVVI